MFDTDIVHDDQNADSDGVLGRLEAAEERLRAAEAIIAMLNDRLAWAEAELAAQAVPCALQARNERKIACSR